MYFTLQIFAIMIAGVNLLYMAYVEISTEVCTYNKSLLGTSGYCWNYFQKDSSQGIDIQFAQLKIGLNMLPVFLFVGLYKPHDWFERLNLDSSPSNYSIF